MRSASRTLPLLLGLVLLAAACGDTAGQDTTTSVLLPAASSSSPASPTTAPAPTTTAAPVTTVGVSTALLLEYTDDSSLDAHYPSGVTAAPVVLMLHGSPGGRSHLTALAKAATARGAMVFNAGWSTDADLETARDEMACLMEFVQTEAERFGGDPTRVTVLGYSAGAARAAVLALRGIDGGESGSCAPAQLRAVGLVGIAGDYLPPEGLDELGADAEVAPGLTVGEWWQISSPYAAIGENPELVVRLVHGRQDAEVAVGGSMQFRDALVAAGYDVRLDVVDSGHTSLLIEGSESFETTLTAVLEAVGRS